MDAFGSWSRRAFLFLLIAAQLSPSTERESVRNVFETANATYNKEFGELNITICEDKSEFSTAFNLHKRLETLMVNYELFVVSTTRKDRRKLISANFNWCKYLKKTKADFISKVIFRALTNEQNHWLTRCPIEEDVYYVNNYSIDTSMIPDGVPEVRYSSAMTAFILSPDGKRIQIFKVDILGHLESSSRQH